MRAVVAWVRARPVVVDALVICVVSTFLAALLVLSGWLAGVDVFACPR